MNGVTVAVKEIEKVTPQLVDAVATLLPQLSRSAPPLSAEDLEDLLTQEDVFFFKFTPDSHEGPEAEAPILGILTLATFEIPTGKRAWIEDVVVDGAARGQGAGQALVEAAIEKAKEVGAVSVDLTSRPSREAANRLYVRCGFEPRKTNVYRYSI